jgi:hypothetical protein
MGLDQNDEIILQISRGASGTWDVSEKDFERPLASFDSVEDACSYANCNTAIYDIAYSGSPCDVGLGSDHAKYLTMSY